MREKNAAKKVIWLWIISILSLSSFWGCNYSAAFNNTTVSDNEKTVSVSYNINKDGYNYAEDDGKTIAKPNYDLGCTSFIKPIGNGAISLNDARIFQDRGNYYIGIGMEFAHNQSTAQSVGLTLNIKLFQNGIGLNDSTYLYIQDESMTEVQRQQNLAFTQVYELRDLETPVEVCVSDFYDFGGTGDQLIVLYDPQAILLYEEAKQTQSDVTTEGSEENKNEVTDRKIESKDIELPAEFDLEDYSFAEMYLVREAGYRETISITIRDKQENETGYTLLEEFNLTDDMFDLYKAAKDDFFAFSFNDSSITEDDDNMGVIYHYGKIINDQVIEFQIIYPESDQEFCGKVIDFLIAEIKSKKK